MTSKRADKMNGKIYLVEGSKGGVGKSMVTMALLDHLRAQSAPVLLIESDTSNPDVWKAYRDEVDAHLLNLDEANGWIELVNVLDANKDHVAVINTAARNNQGVSRYGDTLASTLGELGRNLVTLWVVNRQRDSLELLKEYMDAIPDSQVHVVRNGYFGEEEAFELYNGSKIRDAVEAKGGKSLTFPNLADRVSDDIYTKRLSLAKAAKELPIGNRAELRRWLTLTSGVFGEVVS
ncbi:protein mobD [Xanthomonas citri]|uniref:nucleotide-binding protein n=1 Tax=Xanthomonas citri TaxID=346 RepID=UPI002711FD25|nr:protein mobD [Xanthomonas citri]WLA31800.1 protein mobD [Xanthomonas citri pv. glycines]